MVEIGRETSREESGGRKTRTKGRKRREPKRPTGYRKNNFCRMVWQSLNAMIKLIL